MRRIVRRAAREVLAARRRVDRSPEFKTTPRLRSLPLVEPPKDAAAVRVVPLNALRGISAYPAFSPANDAICFSWNQERGWHKFDVFIQTIGSAVPQQVTSPPAGTDISPVWSPNGHELAFVRVSLTGSTLHLTSVAKPRTERKVRDLFPGRHAILGRQLAWSLDGEALALVDKQSDEEPFAISLVSLETGRAES